MNRNFLVFCAALLMAVSCGSESSLRFMTFNIEHTVGTAEADSTTSWAVRGPHVEAMLLDIHPDVAFFQESQKAQLDSIELHLADTYDVVRYDQKGGGYYFMSFMYDRSKIELLSSEPRWFSPNPFEPFTSGEWNPKYTKMAVLAHFKMIDSGKEFWAIGSHFFPNGEMKIRCSELVNEWIQEKAPDAAPAIACGDMNLTPGDESLKPLYEIMSDAVDCAPDTDGRDTPTFNRWGRGKGKVLDHIFYKDFTPVTYKVVNDGQKYGQEFLSDHYAVYCDFVF